MPFLDWSDDYLIGIAAIDHDHKTLFNLVNRLHDRIEAGDGEDAIGEALAGLAAYVATHFEREERYMDDCGYPDLVRHAERHRKMTDTVNALKTLYEDDPKQIKSIVIMKFLKDWLTTHILKCDMDYRPYMTGEKKGRFMTP